MKKILGTITLAIVLLAFLSISNTVIIAHLNQENQLLKQELTTAKEELQSTKESLEEKITSAQQAISADFKEKITLAQRAISADLEKNVRNEQDNLREVENNLLMELRALEAADKQNLAGVENKIFQSAKVYEKVRKAVVGVNSGTGFLFGSRKLVITAYHVVKSDSEAGTKVSITPNDGSYFWMTGEIKMIKPEWDLAIIELAYPLNTEPLLPANMEKLSVGEQVLVIGNPDGMKNSASSGIISGLYRRDLPDLSSVPLIQFDSAVYFGNSGGPIINSNGEVVGVTVKALKDFTFGFAVPIDKVVNLQGTIR